MENNENIIIKFENCKLRSKLSEINTLAKIAKQCLVTGFEEDEEHKTKWFIFADDMLDIIKYILEKLENEEK